MNLFVGFHRQFHALESLQLLLLFVFVIAYLTTIGPYWGARGRMRAVGIAAAAAIGLCLAMDPWVFGALIVAGAIGAVGLFALAAMVLGRVFAAVPAAARVPAAASLVPVPATPTADVPPRAQRATVGRIVVG